MRVVVHPAARNGCGYWRMILPAEALQAQGADVTIHEGPIKAVWREQAGITECVEVELDADVFVMQRPMKRTLADAIPAMQRQGIKVVVEIDDDFHALPRENQAWPAAQREWLSEDEARQFVRRAGYEHPALRTFRYATWTDRGREIRFYQVPEAVSSTHKGNLMAACKRADLVTCTTQALADRYGKHGRVMIIPNCVPEWWLKVDAPANDPLRVGWTGQVATHPFDLESVGSAVADAVDGCGAVFRSVGSDRPANVLGVKNREHVPWCSFDDYPQQTAELDVGIVPLADTPFNEAKSWLKGLEYAALGVPFVASPTSPYRRLHAEGAGILAHGPTRWREALELLLTNEKVRREQAERGRETASRWTLEANAWRWGEAWSC